jgi:hypothetical protein
MAFDWIRLRRERRRGPLDHIDEVDRSQRRRRRQPIKTLVAWIREHNPLANFVGRALAAFAGPWRHVLFGVFILAVIAGVAAYVFIKTR